MLNGHILPDPLISVHIPSEGLWGSDLIVFESLASTNQWMLDNALALSHGVIVRAKRQTAGRGRFLRPWKTPSQGALTFSCLLDPDKYLRALDPYVSMAAALAVADTIDGYSLHPKLKWPNDVLVNDRKIAGILAEKRAINDPLVLGVGLNVSMGSGDLLAEELMQPATSMSIELCRFIDPDIVLRILSKHLQSRLNELFKNGCPQMLKAWEQKDALIGKPVVIRTPKESFKGVYSGLTSDGRCRLRMENGTENTFDAGDVSLKI